MDQLQQEFNSIIQSFLEKRDEKMEAFWEDERGELEKEIGLLKIQNSKLCSENEKLKRETAKLINGILEVVEMTTIPINCVAVQEEKTQIDQDVEDEKEEEELHSIKDRVKQMGYNPEKFDNTDLSYIGKQMAKYYRQSYDEDPEKREEKINEKHNSLVCVYSKNDWAYIDKLINTTTYTLNQTDEKHNENDAPVLHSIKDRIHNRFNKDPQNYATLLPTIGKKMAAYYRKTYKGTNPAKRDEKINDTHPVCVYGEDDWEYLDNLITTEFCEQNA